MSLGSRPWLRRLGWASIVANVLIILTGGLVRLTSSGLGCPTWPHCSGHSFVPHRALGYHSAIEFGNRTITFLLLAVAVVTLVGAWQSRQRELRMLGLVLLLGVPAQAVIGGVSVLTDLNPWVVSVHLVVSLALVGVAVLFRWRVDHPRALPGDAPRPLVALAWTTYAVSWIVLYLGTTVTGSGPHAGDAKAPRNGLDPLQLSQLHADLVFLLVGLSLAVVLLLHTVGGTPGQLRAAYALLWVEVLQGAIGFTQYFTGLPVALVELHLLGAALVAVAVTWLVLEVREG